MGKHRGSWSAPMSFTDFYFSYEDKEDLIKNDAVCKCIDQQGEILFQEDAYKIYIEMEKVIMEQMNKKGIKTFDFTFG